MADMVRETGAKEEQKGSPLAGNYALYPDAEKGKGKQFTPPSPTYMPPHVAPFSVGFSFVDEHIINPDVELIATAEPVSNIHVCAGCRAFRRVEIKRHNDP
ncbi:hypothetical protein E1301_Tti004116 [Triplophysa tibetana]|uniref:Uncharacterized protein n=1 Tax=Triplophysa tibetana TaxID=1572043 RepID=A0A5A9NKE6_9TELE|nr:hypothetical protein E1301_Tti004116 [Triplophysa tibetana]